YGGSSGPSPKSLGLEHFTFCRNRIHSLTVRFCPFAEGHGMFKTASTFVAVVIAGALVALPLRAYAQYGSGFSGPRGMSPSSTLQSLDQAGPNTLKHAKSDDEQIKDAKRKIIDADPRVRVVALEDLRYV